MTLANEAAYLYDYAKELTKINHKLQRLSKKAEKHIKKHGQASSEDERQKHRNKQAKVTKDIRKRLEKHNEVLINLRRHQIAFANALQKEHKV